jgi:hypothetical protein
MFNFVELNENVVYIAENVKYTLKSETDEIKQIKSLNSALNICFNSHYKQDPSKLNEIKRNIFSYLLKNHLGEKLLVPSPPLNFNLIVHLTIQNHFDDLIDIIEQFQSNGIVLNLYEKLETYLDLYSDRTNQFYLFAINLLLKLKFNSKFNIQSIEVKLLNILQSASKPLIINDHLRINNYLNKGLDCFYTFLKLNEAIKNIDVLTDQFNANKQEIDYLCSLMFYLTNNKFEPIIKYSLNRVDNAFELLSLMKLMKCENKFYSYLKELIEYSYDLIFDEYFIMKQRLVGFEQLLNKYIFLNNDLKLNEKEIDVLQCVQDYITNENDLYSILKRLETIIEDKDLVHKLTQIFWTIFEEFDFEKKLSFISNKIYENHELILDEKNSVVCLLDANYNVDLTLVINQLSYENCEDLQVQY